MHTYIHTCPNTHHHSYCGRVPLHVVPFQLSSSHLLEMDTADAENVSGLPASGVAIAVSSSVPIGDIAVVVMVSDRVGRISLAKLRKLNVVIVRVTTDCTVTTFVAITFKFATSGLHACIDYLMIVLLAQYTMHSLFCWQCTVSTFVSLLYSLIAVR